MAMHLSRLPFVSFGCEQDIIKLLFPHSRERGVVLYLPVLNLTRKKWRFLHFVTTAKEQEDSKRNHSVPLMHLGNLQQVLHWSWLI